MSLDDWLQRIGSLHPKSWDLGLERVSSVAQRLDVLVPAPLVYLVAGTNGKGSTCAAIDAIHRWRGASVGITTSPHLVRFNERIVVDGRAATDEEIVDAFVAIEAARRDVSLTYFEFAALASMLIFKRHAVDVGVLEIGLGGRLDAMNIVDPDISVITRIALDHQSWLGDTREAIGAEKAGIMRRDKPCIIADSNPPSSLARCASECGAKPAWIGSDFGGSTGTGLYVRDATGARRTFRDPGVSRLPRESLLAAIQAATLAGAVPTQEDVDRLFASLTMPGRFHEIAKPRRTIFDVAHNPDAANWLAGRLRSAKRGRCHAVVGMYQDKDYNAVFRTLAPFVDSWYVTRVDEPRAASTDELAAALTRCGGSVAGRYDKVSTAYDQAVEGSKAEDLILVFGSFPVVGEAMKHLRVPV